MNSSDRGAAPAPPPPAFSLKTRRRLFLLAALVLPVLAVLLYSVPPTEKSYYPRCVFHSATGLHCAGCGTTRCLYALLHGQLAQAVAYNVVTVCTLPFILVWLVRSAWAALRGLPPPRSLLPRWTPRALLVVILTFWVVRNIPYYPFTLLAPHPLEPAPALTSPRAGQARPRSCILPSRG